MRRAIILYLKNNYYDQNAASGRGYCFGKCSPLFTLPNGYILAHPDRKLSIGVIGLQRNEREAQGKEAALAWTAGAGDQSTVQLHDMLTDRQPQPGVVLIRLGAEKWIEYLFLNFWWDAATVVTYRNINITFHLELPDHNGQPPLFGHGFNAVDQQIHEELPQCIFVSEDVALSTGDSPINLDFFLFELVL